MLPCYKVCLCTGELLENRNVKDLPLNVLPCCKHGLCTGDLSENIKSKPHEIFLNDLMFLLCQECKIPWQPSYESTYAIDPNSPLHLDIRDYVRNSYRQMYTKMELVWFYYIRNYMEEVEKRVNEEEKNRKAVVSDKEQVNKMILEDFKKGSGQITEDFDDTLLLEEFKKGRISDRTMIRAFEEDLRRRRSQLFNFLIDKDAHDAFPEILEIALSCIALHELGMTDAMFSGITTMIQVFEEYLKKSGNSFDSILHHIFRLAPELPRSPVTNDEIHEAFTRDLLLFMCGLYKTKCFPPNSTTYTIDANSPLTLDIRMYIEKSLADAEVTFYKIYSHYLKKQTVLVAFNLGFSMIMDEIATARIPQGKTVEDLFLLVLNTTKFSFQLYNRRFDYHSTIHLIEQQMPDALRKCNLRNNGRIFELFSAFAKLGNEKDFVRKVKPLDMRFFSNIWLI